MRRSIVRKHHGRIVASPAVIAKQHTRNQRRMPHGQARIVLEVPARGQAVAVHQEQSSALPRIGEFLQSTHAVAGRSVHRYKIASLLSVHNLRGDVAGAGVPQRTALMVDLRHSQRGASCV